MTISKRSSFIKSGAASVMLEGVKFTRSLSLSELHFCPREEEILQTGKDCKIRDVVNAVGDAIAAWLNRHMKEKVIKDKVKIINIEKE